MKLWRIRDSLDLVRNPGAYGSLLVKNLCIDRIRKERKAEPLEERPSGDRPPDETLILKETLGLVRDGIARLPESQRKLLTLHLLQGKNYEEIAAETGLSPLNIRVQISLARKKLRQHEDA